MRILGSMCRPLIQTSILLNVSQESISILQIYVSNVSDMLHHEAITWSKSQKDERGTMIQGGTVLLHEKLNELTP